MAIPINEQGRNLSLERQQKEVEFNALERETLSAWRMKEKGKELRDHIADMIWRDYQTIMRSRRFA